MKTKQLTGIILAGVTGLVMMGMVACDGDNTVTGSVLKSPNLVGADFDYERSLTGSGDYLNVKDLLKDKAFRNGFGFPNTGNEDLDMQEAANTFSNASAKLGRILFYDMS